MFPSDCETSGGGPTRTRQDETVAIAVGHRYQAGVQSADSSVVIAPTAVVESGASIGSRSRIWHFCHVMSGAVIGEDCVFGQGCFVAGGAVIRDRVRLQNNVSVFEGVTLEDEVFCGPGVVFTNVVNPRAGVPRKDEFRQTRVRRGATLGANCTIIAGVEIGEHAFVGAGATVTRSVLPFALMLGVPARRAGWMSRNGQRLHFDGSGRARCSATGEEYRLIEGVAVRRGQ